MAIRLSGLSSNMDTDSMVQALVSAYSIKKDDLVKAQTKLEWKQDAWKSMNSKIYSFYTKQLSNMRLSASYSKKTASITNSNIAKVTASNTAVNGTQSLIVKQLASAGYLTGGKISADTSVNEDGKVTKDTKLSDIAGMSGILDDATSSSSFNVSVGGKNTIVNVTGDTTVREFVSKLQSAGVSASFDETNQRFFVNAKTSGLENDFSITAGNTNGAKTLANLGLLTSDTNTAEYEEYVKWSSYADEFQQFMNNGYTYTGTDENMLAVKAYYDGQYEARKTDTEKEQKIMEKEYATAVSLRKSYEDSKKSVVDKQKEIDKIDVELGSDLLTEKDRTELENKKSKLNEEITKINENITKYETESKEKVDNIIEVKYAGAFDADGKATATLTSMAEAEANSKNQTLANVTIPLEMVDKIEAALNISDIMAANTNQAIKINGQDSEIELNGASYTSNTNNFSVNGLTIQANAVSASTGEGADKVYESTTITTNTDVDGIYDMVKNFFKDYNELINEIDKAYNADSARNYEPLTDEEKDSLSDTEVEKWETKIKDALLRKDGTLGSISSAMKTNMALSYKVDGKSYSLASFGINTLSYFTAADNEKGAYHIDGDSDDSYTSGKEDRLRTAIANDPDTFISFFSQLTAGVYNDLTDRMKSSTLRSAYTVYNDKQLKNEYSEYTKKISKQETKISEMEEYYTRKFTAMEKALSKLNSSQSQLSSLLG